MSTLLKRILFITIVLAIAYGIYWLIDRQGADELKDDIVTKTQKTVENFVDTTTENVLQPVSDASVESLWDYNEILPEKNIVVTNPEIKEPVVQEPVKTTSVKTSSPKKASTSSSNILFQLFK